MENDRRFTGLAKLELRTQSASCVCIKGQEATHQLAQYIEHDNQHRDSRYGEYGHPRAPWGELCLSIGDIARPSVQDGRRAVGGVRHGMKGEGVSFFFRDALLKRQRCYRIW